MATQSKVNLDEPVLLILREAAGPVDLDQVDSKLRERQMEFSRADLTRTLYRLLSDKLAELTPDRKLQALPGNGR